jgi:hypothetical protein
MIYRHMNDSRAPEIEVLHEEGQWIVGMALGARYSYCYIFCKTCMFAQKEGSANGYHGPIGGVKVCEGVPSKKLQAMALLISTPRRARK